MLFVCVRHVVCWFGLLFCVRLLLVMCVVFFPVCVFALYVLCVSVCGCVCVVLMLLCLFCLGCSVSFFVVQFVCVISQMCVFDCVLIGCYVVVDFSVYSV